MDRCVRVITIRTPVAVAVAIWTIAVCDVEIIDQGVAIIINPIRAHLIHARTPRRVHRCAVARVTRSVTVCICLLERNVPLFIECAMRPTPPAAAIVRRTQIVDGAVTTAVVIQTSHFRPCRVRDRGAHPGKGVGITGLGEPQHIRAIAYPPREVGGPGRKQFGLGRLSRVTVAAIIIEQRRAQPNPVQVEIVARDIFRIAAGCEPAETN